GQIKRWRAIRTPPMGGSVLGFPAAPVAGHRADRLERGDPCLQRLIFLARLLGHGAHRLKFLARHEIAVGEPAVHPGLHRRLGLGPGSLSHAHRAGHEFRHVIEELVRTAHRAPPFRPLPLPPICVGRRESSRLTLSRAKALRSGKGVTMQAAIPFPDISSEVFSVELFGAHLALRWYALAYLAGLVGGFLVIRRLMRRAALWPGNLAPMAPERADDLLTAIIL